MSQPSPGILLATQNTNAHIAHLLLVVPGRAGTFWLFLVAITTIQTGKDVLTQIQNFLSSEDYRNSPAKSRGLLFRVFSKETAHISVLSNVSTRL
jgi:hypothetical protein